MNIYQSILSEKQKGNKLLAVLIDPEKVDLKRIAELIRLIHQSIVTHIFVGGSTDINNQIDKVVSEIKTHTILPILIFPGSNQQITNKADGVLFLSLISGRNPEYLIGQQVTSSLDIYNSNLEIIPTGYILVDGGKETAVQRVSKTLPMSQNQPEEILKTALAGQYLGKQIIYLEAGSGAAEAVDPKIITTVREHISIPLIVGGGIRNLTQLENAYNAGADMVVIGTAFEQNPQFFNQLKRDLSTPCPPNNSLEGVALEMTNKK